LHRNSGLGGLIRHAARVGLDLVKFSMGFVLDWVAKNDPRPTLHV